MKTHQRRRRTALFLLICSSMIWPALSTQPSSAAPSSAAPSNAAPSSAAPSNATDAAAQPNDLSSQPLMGTIEWRPRPLSQTLELSESQRQSLTRIYDEFAAKRLAQEEKIARWQRDLQKAQSPASFDERKAAGLSSSIGEAGQHITNAFLQARRKALEVLTPAQRTRLDELSAAHSKSASKPGSPARDEYSQLLLMPVEQLLQTPIDTQAANRLAARQSEREAARRSPYPHHGPSFGFGYGDGGMGLFGGFGYGSGFGFGFGFDHYRPHRRHHGHHGHHGHRRRR